MKCPECGTEFSTWKKTVYHCPECGYKVTADSKALFYSNKFMDLVAFFRKASKLILKLLGKYPTVKMAVVTVLMFVLGSSPIWGIFGEFGGYISAGLMLGGILLLLKLLGILDKVSEVVEKG